MIGQQKLLNNLRIQQFLICEGEKISEQVARCSELHRGIRLRLGFYQSPANRAPTCRVSRQGLVVVLNLLDHLLKRFRVDRLTAIQPATKP